MIKAGGTGIADAVIEHDVGPKRGNGSENTVAQGSDLGADVKKELGAVIGGYKKTPEAGARPLDRRCGGAEKGRSQWHAPGVPRPARWLLSQIAKPAPT